MNATNRQRATVFAPNGRVLPRYARVVEQMRQDEPPRLLAIFDSGAWWALEGSQRLAAAEELGLPVYLRQPDLDARVKLDLEITRPGDLTLVRDAFEHLRKKPGPRYGLEVVVEPWSAEESISPSPAD